MADYMPESSVFTWRIIIIFIRFSLLFSFFKFAKTWEEQEAMDFAKSSSLETFSIFWLTSLNKLLQVLQNLYWFFFFNGGIDSKNLNSCLILYKTGFNRKTVTD